MATSESPVSPETQYTLAGLRQKVRETGTMSRDELKAALAMLRGDRTRAQATSTKSKTAKAAKNVTINSDDLLSELDKLG